MEHETVRGELVKSSLPVGVTALSVLGVSLADWVYVLTLIYLSVQIMSLSYRTYLTWKKAQREEMAEAAEEQPEKGE